MSFVALVMAGDSVSVDKISVVVPIYNEEKSLQALFERLPNAMGEIGKDYELIFVDDGSSDASLSMLNEFYKQHDSKTVIISFDGNYGQHMAIVAGMDAARGDVIVTMDADMQTPPEEIHKLIEKIEEGHDYVGSYRDKRKDNIFRTYISKILNYCREFLLGVKMRDQGCMLRAFRRSVVDQVLKYHDRFSFIPVLAYQHSHSYAEIEMKHLKREFGKSNYSAKKLAITWFDLLTSFSLMPIHIITFTGIVISGISAVIIVISFFAGVLGLMSLSSFIECLLFFVLGVLVFAVGLVGEYVGRLKYIVSNKPNYIIKEKLQQL